MDLRNQSNIPMRYPHPFPIESDLFLEKLRDSNCREIVQRYLFDGFPYCFKDAPELYLNFRDSICNKFMIHQQNFTIVGSGKLGFSLAPQKYGKKFDESSDIDVVLVSEHLFEKIWFSLLDFSNKTIMKLDPKYKEKFKEFKWNLFFGILRMDKISENFPFVKEWWEFFNKLSVDKKFGPRRIRGAIFKSWEHATMYYEYSLKILR